jgi:Uma2 family endonuclease
MNRAPDRLPPGRLTYEDYVELPDDGRRYEVLDGELQVSPAPAPKHQAVARNLLFILHGHVQERRLGTVYCAPIDVILENTTIVQPDLIFLARGREAIITNRAIEGPPDLVIEILSPSSARRDRGTKAGLYARFGIRHYWLVDPDGRVLELYEAEGAEYCLATTHDRAARVRTALFPDLEIDLGQVWV